VVLVGHGRVGGFISAKLQAANVPLLVIETNEDKVPELRKDGVEVIRGNAADPEVTAAANIGAARCLLVAIPDAFEGSQVVEQARALNPDLPIIARAHSDAEKEHLFKYGASRVVLGEQEIARAMVSDIPEAPREPVQSAVEPAEAADDGPDRTRPALPTYPDSA
jgi:CPA2 family monovalent cation:H+ antiporter-2